MDQLNRRKKIFLLWANLYATIKVECCSFAMTCNILFRLLVVDSLLVIHQGKITSGISRISILKIISGQILGKTRCGLFCFKTAITLWEIQVLKNVKNLFYREGKKIEKMGKKWFSYFKTICEIVWLILYLKQNVINICHFPGLIFLTHFFLFCN